MDRIHQHAPAKVPCVPVTALTPGIATTLEMQQIHLVLGADPIPSSLALHPLLSGETPAQQ